LYDVENRWIGEDIENGAGVVQHETRFVYDGNQIVLQFDTDVSGTSGSSGATGSASAMTAADLSHRYLWGPAVDQILADEQLSPLPSGEGQGEGYNLQTPGTVVWPMTDNQGTVRDLAVCNATTDTTAVVNHLVYSSYGQLLSQTNPATGNAAAVDCLFGYDGMPYDQGSQTNVAQQRRYAPATGRWMSVDPSVTTGGETNFYGYCGNSPANFTDPNGADAESVEQQQAWYEVHVNIVVWSYSGMAMPNYQADVAMANQIFRQCHLVVKVASVTVMTEAETLAVLHPLQTGEKTGTPWFDYGDPGEVQRLKNAVNAAVKPSQGSITVNYVPYISTALAGVAWPLTGKKDVYLAPVGRSGLVRSARTLAHELVHALGFEGHVDDLQMLNNLMVGNLNSPIQWQKQMSRDQWGKFIGGFVAWRDKNGLSPGPQAFDLYVESMTRNSVMLTEAQIKLIRSNLYGNLFPVK
jgi:RHS repeat-associated protein